MRRTTHIITMIMTLLACCYGIVACTEHGRNEGVVKTEKQHAAGEVIVIFKTGISREEAESIAESRGMEVVQYYKVLSERNHQPHLLLTSTLTTASMMEKLRNHEAVEAVSPNYRRKTSFSESPVGAKDVTKDTIE